LLPRSKRCRLFGLGWNQSSPRIPFLYHLVWGCASPRLRQPCGSLPCAPDSGSVLLFLDWPPATHVCLLCLDNHCRYSGHKLSATGFYEFALHLAP